MDISKLNLDGAWEPDHIGPRVEIKGNRMIRLWRGSPVLETESQWKKVGDHVLLVLENTGLRRRPGEEPYASVKECRYQDNTLVFVDDFPISGESTITLRRTENNRYGNVDLLGDDIYAELEGTWKYAARDASIIIHPGLLSIEIGESRTDWIKIVVTKNRSTGEVQIRDLDPAKEGMDFFGPMTYRDGKIFTYVPVTDVTPVDVIFEKGPNKEPRVCGGSEDLTDYNAPTAIVSDRIMEFSCCLYLAAMKGREGYGPERELSCTLYAKREIEGTKCHWRTDSGLERVFQTNSTFLDTLQEIISRYDLVQFNGRNRVTHGMPRFFGDRLDVTYESGERIYASDNQSPFLPSEAVQELLRLFFSNSPGGRRDNG